MELQINEARFRDTFETYSQIGATKNGGLHRLALSEADRAVRNQFVDDLETLGIETWVDTVGNIFGRRDGDQELSPVLIGSHLDSQPHGGCYDGQLGVLCALETLRALDDQNINTDRPIEIVNWTNEEGSRFNLAPLGSATFVGEFSIEEALSAQDEDGVSVAAALEEIGFDGEEPCEPHPIDSFLELHIEQGPRLEEDGDDIGVVQGIVGMRWLRVTITGEADHAGTTPMYDRSDALATATTVIQQLRTLGSYLSDDAVLTVGELDIEPGSINTIPETVSFTIDLRCYDDGTRATALTRIERELSAATERQGTSFEIKEIMNTNQTEFSSRVQRAIATSADRTGATSQQMISGAGHDAMYVSDIADTAMIFVPSVDGKSHSKDEYTEWEDVLTGAAVYANATMELAKANDCEH